MKDIRFISSGSNFYPTIYPYQSALKCPEIGNVESFTGCFLGQQWPNKQLYQQSRLWPPVHRGPILYTIHYFSQCTTFCSLFVHYWSCTLLDMLLDQENKYKGYRFKTSQLSTKKTWSNGQPYPVLKMTSSQAVRHARHGTGNQVKIKEAFVQLPQLNGLSCI